MLTLLLLLWVGFDLGAHGLLASDFPPLSGSGPSTRLASCTDQGGTDAATTPTAPDHCFCHSISVGAVVPAAAGPLAAVGAIFAPFAQKVPLSDRIPLDHPPQLHS